MQFGHRRDTDTNLAAMLTHLHDHDILGPKLADFATVFGRWNKDQIGEIPIEFHPQQVEHTCLNYGPDVLGPLLILIGNGYNPPRMSQLLSRECDSDSNSGGYQSGSGEESMTFTMEGTQDLEPPAKRAYQRLIPLLKEAVTLLEDGHKESDIVEVEKLLQNFIATKRGERSRHARSHKSGKMVSSSVPVNKRKRIQVTKTM